MGLLKFLVVGGAIAYLIKSTKEHHKNTRVYRVIQNPSKPDEYADDLPPYYNQGLPSMRQRIKDEARKSRPTATNDIQEIPPSVEQQSHQQHQELPMSRSSSPSPNDRQLYFDQVLPYPEPTNMDNNNIEYYNNYNTNNNHPSYPQPAAATATPTYQDSTPPLRGWMILEQNPVSGSGSGYDARHYQQQQQQRQNQPMKKSDWSWFWSW